MALLTRDVQTVYEECYSWTSQGFKRRRAQSPAICELSHHMYLSSAHSFALQNCRYQLRYASICHSHSADDSYIDDCEGSIYLTLDCGNFSLHPEEEKWFDAKECAMEEMEAFSYTSAEQTVSMRFKNEDVWNWGSRREKTPTP